MGTKIEWSDETWNPIVGCSHTSPGCDNCYAERMAARLAAMACSPKTVVPRSMMKSSKRAYIDVVKMWHNPKTERTFFRGWNGKTAFVESALTKPLHWKTPRHIFVCSMSDLFHPSVPFEWIDKVVDVLEKCPQHTGQLVTKRAERMYRYSEYRNLKWPENIVGIVTAENQEMADKRILWLLRCGFKTTGVSVEPMLSEMDLKPYISLRLKCIGPKGCLYTGPSYEFVNPRKDGAYACPKCKKNHSYLRTDSIDWVICGGESGPGARPMDPDWAGGLRDQCEAAEVPFFFKRWGNPTAWNNQDEADREKAGIAGLDWSKTKGGRLLDGVEHNEMPEAV